MVSVTPVGNYFGNGGVQGVHASVSSDYDRAAPRGTGDVKAGGNYAADLLPLKIAKAEGYGTTLYLDAKTQQYVEEFSVSNFIGIDKDGRLPHAVVVVDPAVDHQQDADAARARPRHRGQAGQRRLGATCPLPRGRRVRHRDGLRADRLDHARPEKARVRNDVKHEFGRGRGFEILNELRRRRHRRQS